MVARPLGAAQPTDAGRARNPLSELLSRIDAVTGQPIALIVPMEVIAAGTDRSQVSKQRTPFAVLLDDGTRLRFRVSVLRVLAMPAADGAPTDEEVARMARWLGPQWVWSAEELAPQAWASATAGSNAEEPKAALLVIEPPLGTDSQALWLGASRVPVQWLPSPATVVLAEPELSPSTTGNPWVPTLPPNAFGSDVIKALLTHEAGNPLTRWRVRLLLDGLAPQHQSQPSSVSTMLDAPLELLARQYEQRWTVALARLAAHDRELEARLRARLSRVVMVEDRMPVPAWEHDLGALEQLLDDLLNPRLSPQRRAEHAAEFCDAQPAGVAWITDDGGLLVQDKGANDAPRRPWATVALANLERAPAAAVVQMRDDDAPAPEPIALAGGASTVLTTPLLAIDDESLALEPGARALGLAGAGEVEVAVGGWASRLSVLDGPLPAQPPGLASGPFQADMDMSQWLTNAASQSPAPWATAALLQRVAAPAVGTLAHRAWEIYIEARVPAPAATDSWNPATDTLFLYAGPVGAPTAAWRITRDGAIVSIGPDRPVREQFAEAQEISMPSARVDILGDRWIARIPLPPGSIEPDGLLRLGLSRIDPRGVRSSWPRALVPWQAEPSRAAIDTTTWEGPQGAE